MIDIVLETFLGAGVLGLAVAIIIVGATCYFWFQKVKSDPLLHRFPLIKCLHTKFFFTNYLLFFHFLAKVLNLCFFPVSHNPESLSKLFSSKK